MGGVLAKYAAQGVETYLITATRGEYGWPGAPEDNPGPVELGRIREAELREAARVLNIKEVMFLDYIDGYVDEADPTDAIEKIAVHMRRIEPDVVITFDPYGAYGHPDHIAISQFATAAAVEVSSPSYRVKKLYYLVETEGKIRAYQKVFGDLIMPVDGIKRQAPGWPQWAITTRIDTLAYWRDVVDAISCHRTQLPEYDRLRHLPEDRQHELWGLESYYRAFSLVNGGRAVERGLFEGLNVPHTLAET